MPQCTEAWQPTAPQSPNSPESHPRLASAGHLLPPSSTRGMSCLSPAATGCAGAQLCPPRVSGGAAEELLCGLRGLGGGLWIRGFA